MEPAEAILASASKMAVAFTENTTPESLQKLARSIAPIIVVMTQTGHAAALISKYRPPCPIVVASNDEQVLRQCNALFAHRPLKVGPQASDTWST
jgi:pyruvate kinase